MHSEKNCEERAVTFRMCSESASAIELPKKVVSVNCSIDESSFGLRLRNTTGWIEENSFSALFGVKKIIPKRLHTPAANSDEY